MLPALPKAATARHRHVRDFREYTSSSQPNEWTKRGATTTPAWSITSDGATAGGKRLGVASPASVGTNISFDPAGVVTDGEALALVKTGASTTASVINVGLAMRASAGSDVAYTAYLVRHSGINSGNFSLYVARDNVAAITSTTFAWAANTRYWIRFRMQGTSLQVKVWAYGSAEPASWTISTTDANLASGYVGINCPGTVNGPQGTIEFFSFAPGNRTAPGLSG